MDQDLHKLLADNASDILWVLDVATSAITYVSPACERILGFTPEEQIERIGTFEMLTPESAAVAGQTMQGLFTGDSDECSYEAEHFTKAGGTVWCEIRVRIRRNAEGYPVDVIGITRDISARKRLQAELRASEARAAQGQRLEAIGQVASSVAHDFNNILTVVMANLELAQLSLSGSDAASEFVADARTASERGAGLTRRLLAFSRSQPLRPVGVSLETSFEALRPLIDKAVGPAVSVAIELDSDLWPCLADPTELENAVLNLALNGSDAMKDGGELRIEVRNGEMGGDGVRPDQESADCVVISVTDTGQGMDAETAQRVLEPFFTTKSGGTGLGLSTVTGFARQSGGDLTIHSEVGRGTTVELRLPRAKSAAPNPWTTQRSTARGAGQRILVVDDDAAIRQVLSAMLAEHGYKAVLAADGSSAMRWIEDEPDISALLTDVLLGSDPDGFGVVQAVRTKRPDLPCAYMSGWVDTSRGGTPDFGQDEPLLRKPFSGQDLLRTLAQLTNAT